MSSNIAKSPSLSTRNVLKKVPHLATALALVCAAPAWAGPSVYPDGTTRYDHERAYDSYVLFTAGDNISRLIDLNGKTLHQWPDAGGFSSLLDPALNKGRTGHVFVTLETIKGSGIDLVPGRVGNQISKTIAELDWDGKAVWRFGEKAPGGLAQQHHDWARLPNGNTIVLSNLVHPVAGFKQQHVLDDVIYEVNPGGDIVWTWVASDHLDEFGFTPEQLQLVRNADSGDYLHVNNLKVVGPNHWFDGGDKRFDPDNLIFCSRNANFTAIIDKKSGKIAWLLGPNYPALAKGNGARKVPRPVDQISGQHDAHIIGPGLPGAGNLLVFDNQGEAGYPAVELQTTGGSRVLEINPVTREIVWQYSGEDSGGPSWSFRSTHISAARRLPNGNTFIDEGQSGRLFQITRDGDIVWEYVNPYPRKGMDPLTNKATANRQLYRAEPVPISWVPGVKAHANADTPNVGNVIIAN